MNKTVVAKVERQNGEPAILIDADPYPPMSITVLSRPTMTLAQRKAYYRDLGEAGIKTYYITATTRWNNPGDPGKGIPDGITATLSDLVALLESVPDAYAMLRLNVSPPPEWVNSHPEEQVKFSDGSSQRCICTSVSPREIIDGMHLGDTKMWQVRDGIPRGAHASAPQAPRACGRDNGLTRK